MRPAIAAALACGFVLALCACEREARRYEDRPPHPGLESVHVGSLEPGAPAPRATARSPYQGNAYGVAEGKRLYSAFNCNGCHALGGGGIGPALMDEKWIYGAAPEQIYASIVQGRPNGMPAFGARVPPQQVWQLVAYVQSLGGNVPRDAAPGRDDDLAGKKAEARTERLPPQQTGPR
jgi:cytochrome c oxidase cbb3-type subunit 3